MSPDNITGSYSKGGTDLADALEQVADDPGLIASPESAFEVLGISLPSDVVPYAPLDKHELRRAARAIREGAVPAFWPWIWWIPWICFSAPLEGGGGTAD